MQTQQSSEASHGVLALDNVNGANGEEESRGGRKPKRTYICQTCQKSFKRREHCMRHERGHTKEKPYLCRYCKRTYARRDLVTRHEKSLHADQWTAPPSSKLSRAAATNGGPPQEPENEQDESLSSNGQDDASPDDGDPGTGLNIHIPLTPGEMEGTQDVFSLPEGFMSSTPPSLEDLLSLQNGIGNQYGSMSAISTEYMDTSPAINVATNPFDAFQAITAVDSPQRPPDYGQHASSQYSQISNGTYNHHLPMSNYNDTNIPHANSRRDSSITQLYSWADIGAAHSESPSSIGRIPSKVPTLEVDDGTHNFLFTSMGNYLAPHLQRQFRLPSKNIIERCLSSYLTCFHFHFPIVHIASLNLFETPAPLVLAMCAIGALFRLERKHAVSFRECVDRALASEKLKNSTVGIFSSWPTWMAQCKLLSLFAALFSGDLVTVTLALQSMGSLTTEYRHRRVELTARPDDYLSFSWTDWIDRETSKRILYGTFALSNLVNITFGSTPRMSIIPDAEIEMPDDERLWDANSENQWTELMVLLGPIDRTTMRSALNQIITRSGGDVDFTSRIGWSSFSATVIMHAMNIYVWHLIQSSQALSGSICDGTMEGDLKTSLLNQAEVALARCSELFIGGNPESEGRLNELEVSQRSNCNALLRTAYVRAANSENSLERVMVLGGDPQSSQRTIQSFVTTLQHRSEFVTKAVSTAYHGLQTSVRAGHLLVKKTAAFKWSIDHAIADWDCVLFVSRWIYTLERQQQTQPPTPSEMKNLSELRQLLTDVETDFVGQTSLAAAVTRVWAGFFDDTWVWGITPRMAAVMRQLADGYDAEWRTRDINS